MSKSIKKSPSTYDSKKTGGLSVLLQKIQSMNLAVTEFEMTVRDNLKLFF